MAALVDESEQPPGLQMMDDMVLYFEEQGQAIDQLTDSMVHDSLPLNHQFISTIRFSGNPILPPVMTSKRRQEMQTYKRQAMIAETRLASRRREKRAKALAHIYSIVDSVEERSPSPPSSSEEHSNNARQSDALPVPFVSYGLETAAKGDGDKINVVKQISSKSENENQLNVKSCSAKGGSTLTEEHSLPNSTVERTVEVALKPEEIPSNLTNPSVSMKVDHNEAVVNRLQQGLNQNKVLHQQQTLPVSMVGSTSSSATTLSTESDELFQTVIARLEPGASKSDPTLSAQVTRKDNVNCGESSQNKDVQKSLSDSKCSDVIVKRMSEAPVVFDKSDADIFNPGNNVDGTRKKTRKTTELRDNLNSIDHYKDCIPNEDLLDTKERQHLGEVETSTLKSNQSIIPYHCQLQEPGSRDFSPGPNKTPDVSIISYVSEDESHNTTEQNVIKAMSDLLRQDNNSDRSGDRKLETLDNINENVDQSRSTGVSSSSREHSGIASSREHSGIVSSREHSGIASSREHSGIASSSEHSGIASSREHSGIASSREHSGIASGSEQVVRSVDTAQMGTASTDLGQYMHGSLDTITSSLTVTERRTKSITGVTTDDECFTENGAAQPVSSNVVSGNHQDITEESDGRFCRPRSNSYTLDQPSPALMQSRVSDVSNSRSKSRSCLPDNSVLGADAQDAKVYESLENFTRSVQRKLDYSEADDTDDLTNKRKKQMQNQTRDKVSLQGQNHTRPQKKLSGGEGEQFYVNEAASQQGKQEHLNRYLKQLGQDPFAAMRQNQNHHTEQLGANHIHVGSAISHIHPGIDYNQARPSTAPAVQHSPLTNGSHGYDPGAEQTEGAYAMAPGEVSALDLPLDLASLQNLTAEELEEHFADVRRQLMMQQKIQLQQLFLQQQEEQMRLQQEVVMQEKLLRGYNQPPEEFHIDDQVLHQQLQQDNEKWSLQLQHRMQLQELQNLEHGDLQEAPSRSGDAHQYGGFNVAQYASPMRERRGQRHEGKNHTTNGRHDKPEAKRKVQRRLNVDEDNRKAPVDGTTRKFEKVSAAVKGYLTRALLRTDKLQYLIKTIRDTADFAVHFQGETPIKNGVYSMQDKNLQDRVVAQLRAALLEIHDIFFELPIAERMNIIAHHRQREVQKYFIQNSRLTSKQKPTKRRVSDATKKAMDRRQKAQAAEIAVFGDVRPKTAPPNTSSPKNYKITTDLIGPIQRKHQHLIIKALQPIQAQISPIKPVKDNLNRVVAGERPKTAPSTTNENRAPHGGNQNKQKVNTTNAAAVPMKGVKKTLYGAVMGISKKKTNRPLSPKNKAKVKK